MSRTKPKPKPVTLAQHERAAAKIQRAYEDGKITENQRNKGVRMLVDAFIDVRRQAVTERRGGTIVLEGGGKRR